MEKYRVIKTIRETNDTTTIQFVALDNKANYDFNPGQYITVYFPELGVPEGKAYSLSSLPTDDFISITVKSIGDYSKRICELSVDDVFMASSPYGFLFEDTGGPLVCITAGVGISPVWSIIRSVLNNDANRKIYLIYSNKTIDDIVFHDAISDLKKKYANFDITHHVTRQKIAECEGYANERIDASDAAQTILGNDSSVVICGSQNFVVDIYKSLQNAGVAEDRISTEIFFQTPWK